MTPRRIHGLLPLLMLLSACTATRPYVDAPYAGWETKTPPPEANVAYRVFLIGDTGRPALDRPKPTLRWLKTRLADAGENAAVVVLGDNIYCCGLADSGYGRRAQDERRLLPLLQAVEDFQGRIVILPGERDWNDGQPRGAEAVARQEAFVEAHLARGNVFLPDDGFPGPTEVKLTDRIRLVVLDTQWWLYDHDKPFGDAGDYELEENADFLLQLDDLIKRRDDEDLLVVGHHPLLSLGRRGGYLPLRDHLFPLRRLHPALWIPLPLVGSVYPLYVRFAGGEQDLSHPPYRTLRQALTQLFTQHGRLIYAAGHDHSLQYIPGPTTQYIVSGAGTEAEPVARGRGAAFTYGGEGFAELTYYRDGAAWLAMWVPEGNGAAGRLLFQTQVLAPAPELVDPGVPAYTNTPNYSDSTTVLAAGPRYAAGPIKSFFLGSHHRDTWAMPVRLPYLDVGTVAGGLTPVKRGGGMQTISLRLEGADGHQYVLRTIDKDPARSVPANLQGTIATDIVQDQIATIHPYGAFIIPRLADAVGVYHTNPRLYYVPHDPRLGIYRPLFAGTMVMLEERPDDDEHDRPSFGRSKEVISADKLYREITDDNDHRVDVRAFARARLLDMLLSDWDRHADQWRWAAFEPYELDPTLTGEARTQGKVYRPIPRDRDFAFNRLNGLLPSFAPIFDRKFQDFTEGYGNLKGLNLNGRLQDHRLVSPLTRQDFIDLADSIRAALTDDVIDQAVRDWPESIFERDGPQTARLLRIRRDKLPAVAARFYALHARTPDVVGSNKHERFEVTRLTDDSTRVIVYKTSKKGEVLKELYRRTFVRGETKEVRLYGLGGNDQFIVEGDVGRGILVRGVGGPGEDTFVDRSRVGGFGRRTHFYDTETGNTWEVGSETKTTRSDEDPAVNAYDWYDFNFNSSQPLLFFGSNTDDGLFVGGGVHFIRHGFRKKPYAASHRIKANVAAKTQAFNVVYQGHYVRALGTWDVALDAAYLSPNNIRNFYGLGNETENDERSRRFYQARLTQATLAAAVERRLEPGATFRFGPTFQFTEVREEDRFVNRPQPGVSDNTFDDQWFAGARAEVVLETVDSRVNPKQGFSWSNAAALHGGIRNATDTYGTLSSDLAFYLSPSLAPQVTLAARIGGAHNVGDFPFYGANTLGGGANLRGYRSTRYAGRTSFYQNVDLRVELLRFSTYLAIGRAGLLGFFDNGRVWTEADDAMGGSTLWHQGYGGGLWFDLFNTAVLAATAGFSEDDRTVTVGLGFQF